jgi:hypothetical protein
VLTLQGTRSKLAKNREIVKLRGEGKKKGKERGETKQEHQIARRNNNVKIKVTQKIISLLNLGLARSKGLTYSAVNNHKHTKEDK